MTKFIFVFIFTLLVFKAVPQKLEFYREDLTFQIKDGYLYVDGVYYFCNVSDKVKNTRLYYPFPVSKIYGDIDSVNIVNLKTTEDIKYIENKGKGIYYYISTEPYGTGKYRIKYRQKLLANQAEYILTTTQSWNKPFEVVNYKLIIPDSITITALSYNADTVLSDKQDKIYIWKKKDFMPDRDMIIRFE